MFLVQETLLFLNREQTELNNVCCIFYKMYIHHIFFIIRRSYIPKNINISSIETGFMI